MDNKEKKLGTDELLAQLNISENQINSLDTKLSVNLAFLGVFIGFILNVGFSFNHDNFLSVYLYLLTMISVFVAVIYTLLGMKSTIKKISSGLWSFKDVANFDHHHSFEKKKRAQSVEDYQKGLLNHIYTSAKLGGSKHKCFERSLAFTIISVITFSSNILFGIILGFFAAR